MTTSEREMIRPLDGDVAGQKATREERFTSLQPTYEDSVQPRPDDDWEEWSDRG